MKRFLVLATLLAACTENRSSLEASARGYMDALGYTVVGVVCMDMDSDGDGYVSCTARVKEIAPPIAVDCASNFSYKTGCRMQKMSNTMLRGE